MFILLSSLITFFVSSILADEVVNSGNTPVSSENSVNSYRNFSCTKDVFFTEQNKDKQHCKSFRQNAMPYIEFLTALESTTDVDNFISQLDTLRKYLACGSDRAGYNKTQKIWTQWTDEYVICQVRRVRQANRSMTSLQLNELNKKAMEIQCIYNIKHTSKDRILKYIEDPSRVTCGEQYISTQPKGLRKPHVIGFFR